MKKKNRGAIKICRQHQRKLLRKHSVTINGQIVLTPDDYEVLREIARVAVEYGDKDQKAHLYSADDCRISKFSYYEYPVRVEDNPKPKPISFKYLEDM